MLNRKLGRLILNAPGLFGQPIQVMLLLYLLNKAKADRDGYMTVNITHREIADACGLTRRTVGIHMEILRKRGMVDYADTGAPAVHIQMTGIVQMDLLTWRHL